MYVNYFRIGYRVSATDQQTKPIFASAVDCERAFYAAFIERSFESMRGVWADEHVSCIHPGSRDVLRGNEAVLAAWKSILEMDEVPDIRVVLLERESGRDLTTHLVREEIYSQDGVIRAVAYATNIFRREADSWRMVGHHGSVASLTAKSPSRSLH